jgi:S1-C subfamily serine protease
MLGGIRTGATLTLMVALSGCATQYGPAGFLTGGYRDEAIGGDQYHISISGNNLMGVGAAEEYFYRRAQEIVKQHGYRSYRVIQLRSGLEPSGGGFHPVARGVIQGIGGKASANDAEARGGGSSGTQQMTYSGTGFFLGTGGFVLTNQHVVAHCQDITIRQFDGSVTPATVMASDAANDLAILKSVAKSPAYARFREDPELRRGDNIVAFGFPMTNVLSSGGAVTNGTVSALSGPRDDSRLLQISVPIQPGNSGGPLLDQSGNVVGITSSGFRGNMQNVNFAIKATVARSFLDTHSVSYQQAPSTKVLSTRDIAALAEKFTVFITCPGS